MFDLSRGRKIGEGLESNLANLVGEKMVGGREVVVMAVKREGMS